MRWVLPLALVVVLAGCGSTRTHAPSAPTPRASTPPGPASFTRERCAGLVVLGLRGQGQSPTTHQGVGHEVQVAVRSTVRHLRGTTVRLQAVRYPAVPAATEAEYDHDIATGVRLVDRATGALAGCPHTRVALVGFSEGAQVAHTVAARHAYPLVVLIGDPLRNPRLGVRTLSFGTHLTGRGSAVSGAGYGPAFADPATVVEACVAGDNVCNAPLGGRVGGVSATHRSFYERPATARVIGRAAAVGADP